MEFSGFPSAALDFYDDLEVDNTKSFWEAHKAVYADAVKAPMVALCSELAQEFGEATVFRPYRDVRFAKDKTPYKTHQGAFVASGPATGWYVELSPRGVRTGAGFYDAARTGRRLERILSELAVAGWSVEGDRLKTAPRGYPVDHPRIELLRHRSLVVMKSYGFAPVIHDRTLVDALRGDWRALRPLVDWVGRAVADV